MNRIEDRRTRRFRARHNGVPAQIKALFPLRHMDKRIRTELKGLLCCSRRAVTRSVHFGEVGGVYERELTAYFYGSRSYAMHDKEGNVFVFYGPENRGFSPDYGETCLVSFKVKRHSTAVNFRAMLPGTRYTACKNAERGDDAI